MPFERIFFQYVIELMAHYWGQINYFDAVLMQINCTKMAHSNVIQFCQSIFLWTINFQLSYLERRKNSCLIFGTHV